MLTARTFSDTPRQHSSRQNDKPYKMVASTSVTAIATATATHVATATAAATYPSTSHHWF